MDNITVIIPYYNRKNSIQHAVDSVLAQTHQNLQIIIVDDGSIEPLEFFGGDRITIIRHDTNKGAAAARNTAIQATKTDWIAFLDSDDLWQKDKLEQQLKFMVAHNINASTTYALFGDKKRELPDVIGKPAVLGGQGINFGSCFMCKRNLFDEVGLLDESLSRLEDWDWLIRFVNLGHDIHTVPFYGSIIQVGSPPSIEAVNSSAQNIVHKYKKSQRVQAAAMVEIAANNLWHGKLCGFIQYWVKAFFLSPLLALNFVWTRIKRISGGDAPRFFKLFR